MKHITLEEIEKILFEAGYFRRTNSYRDYNVSTSSVYEFEQQYPGTDDNNMSVRFEDYNNEIIVHYSCLNIGHSDKLTELKSKEEFLESLDTTILWGKTAWIYSDKCYFSWRFAADEQRKRYFEKRMAMDIPPSKKIIEHIEKEGLEHHQTLLDIKYGNKLIGEMSWEELATALAKEQIKNKKTHGKKNDAHIQGKKN